MGSLRPFIPVALPPKMRGGRRASTPAVDSEALIVVVAGQSNARSFNTTGSDVPVDLQGTNPNVKVWNTNSQTWEDYEAGVNSDTFNSGASTPQKWGPEAAFIHDFAAANPSVSIYIVKVTKDSTTLGTQAGDDWNPANSGEMYDDLQTELDAAKAALVTAGKTPVVAAILWMQGEHDALDGTLGTNYGVNLAAFISSVRSDWGDSNTKFILGRITPSAEWATAGTSVRALQARIARDTADAQAIDTDSYTLAGDNRHYVAASVRTLGEEMYDAYAGSYTLIPVRFGTMAADKYTGVTLSNGNLSAEGTGTTSSALMPCRCDQFPLLAGKSYWEFLIDQQTASLNVGMGKSLTMTLGSFWGGTSDSIGYSAAGAVFKGNVNIATYATYTAGDRIMMAFDGATGKVWFGKNGTWNGNPAAGTGQAATLTANTTTSYHRIGATLRRSGDKVTLKFRSADFLYTPPSGFLSI